MSERQVRRRLESGAFERVHGVLAVAGVPHSWERSAAAALVAVAGGVLSHRSAARVHRFTLVRTDDAVTITAPIGAHHAVRGIDVRRSRLLPAEHVTEVDGLAVTTPARTLVDLAAELNDGRLRQVVEDQLSRRTVTWDELVATRAALSARGRAGSSRFRRVMESVEGRPPTESVLERSYLRLLDAAGVPHPQMQVTAPWAEVEPGRVDGMYPATRAIVELDGRTFHARASAIERDHRRDQLAVVAGYSTTRFTFQMIRSDPRHVVDVSRHLARPHT